MTYTIIFRLCHHKKSPFKGSYECKCLVGYIGNPESTEVCSSPGVCPLNHGCIPEPCDLGYYGAKSHGCYALPDNSVCKGAEIRGLNYQCASFECDIGFEVVNPHSKTSHKEHQKWYHQKKDEKSRYLDQEEYDCIGEAQMKQQTTICTDPHKPHSFSIK